MRVLIVFGTRYGATSETSEGIGKILSAEGFEVVLIDAKEEKLKELNGFDLVIVGTGMKADRWTREAEDFLRKFQKELEGKKTALFVSSALQAIFKHEGEKEALDKSWRKYIEEKAENYSLKPIALGLFGGVLDYNKMGFIARKTLGSFKERLEAVGYKERKPGVYDTRDWNEIRDWTRKLALKARYL